MRDPVADLIRLTEQDIAAFEGRMRDVVPSYHAGERVLLHGEVFQVVGFEPEGMPSYRLRAPGKKDLLLPIDRECDLEVVLHQKAPHLPVNSAFKTSLVTFPALPQKPTDS